MKQITVFEMVDFMVDCIDAGMSKNKDEFYDMQISGTSVSGRTLTIQLKNGQVFEIKANPVVLEVSNEA